MALQVIVCRKWKHEIDSRAKFALLQPTFLSCESRYFHPILHTQFLHRCGK
jgi:hypothetical protein